MTNEATLMVETQAPFNFTCVNDIGIEKGTILTLSDPLTASKAAAAIGLVAGIAANEKIANDGKTKIAVYRQGWFEMTASGAIGIGKPVQNASDANYPNTVMAAAVTSSGACIVGHALEAASDAERIMVDVNIGAGGAAVS